MITVLLILSLNLWMLIGGIAFMAMYVTPDYYGNLEFTDKWHKFNKLQKRFIFVVHGPIVMLVALVALTIRKTFRIINVFYTTALDILGKQTNQD